MRISFVIAVLTSFLVLIFEIATADHMLQEYEKDQNLRARSTYGIKKENYVLSDWQLRLLNDRMFEITANRCPDLNGTILNELKLYIRSKVSRASPQVSMSEIFYPIYGDLSDCIQELNNTRKASSSWPTSFADTPKVILPQDVDKFDTTKKMVYSYTGGQMYVGTKNGPLRSFDPSSPKNALSIFNFAWNLVRSLFNSTGELFKNMVKRAKVNSSDQNPTNRPSASARADVDSKTATRTGVTFDPLVSAKNQFSDLIQTLTKIVCYVCPFERTVKYPLQAVTGEVGNQIFEWTVKNEEGIVEAANHFFENAGLLAQIRDCQGVVAIDRIVSLRYLIL